MVEAIPQDVIIIGAGVVGLTLAHSLKKQGIPFQIFERDSDISARGQGWAITIHWALPYLRSLLSPETLAEVDEVQVDPAIGRNDSGNFHFINLSNCETKFRIPPLERRRINREKFRAVLLKGVAEHVHWSKRLSKIETSTATSGVQATFEDGTTVRGSILIGADGSNSAVRKSLCPTAHRNTQLPIRFVGSGVDMTKSQVTPLRDLDPLLFQGCHPQTSCFMWVSMLEVPSQNGTLNTPHERYRVQINLSWPVRDPANDEVKPTSAERLQDMKRRASAFAPVLRDAVESIPDAAGVIEIKLADWPCLEWDNRQGRITLAGDAAHAMTMYRGEAANHGILDAFHLAGAISKLYNNGASDSERGEGEGEGENKEQTTRESVITEYESEMRSRTSQAVLLSRQACIDAHDWERLNENSPVVAKRVAVSAK